ncbi:hypothetical protein [Streptomyces sp. CB02923]|uniref:hypothetical protein n=1 Tax=Streptomyces sp. CB02923 TaxID=1718985 RepID=UPI0019029641|nr:hypothetical protein [Streptomyces sp. CB02923]
MAVEEMLAVSEVRPSLAVMLDLAARLREDALCYAAAAVIEARSEGSGWIEIADAAGATEASVRARWGGAKAQTILARRQSATDGEVKLRSRPFTAGQGSGCDVLPVPPVAEEAVRHLAKALTTLRHMSDVELTAVAERTVLPVSLVALVCEGRALPSWPVTYMLAEATGGAPGDLRLLWERAWGPEPFTPLNSPQRLSAALRGAHLAAGAPELSCLCAQADLDAAVVGAALDGRTMPAWDTIRALLTHLGAEPDAYRALWKAGASSCGAQEGDPAQ